MIEHLQKFKELGIKALKIEGRNKSEYYTALTVRSYRNALDELKYPESERNTGYWKETVVPAAPAAHLCSSVQDGDTLWSVVFNIYGNVERLDEFAAYNRNVLPSPDALAPGMELRTLPVQ